jgi:hypothetical protein
MLVIVGVTLRGIKIEKFDESLEKFFLAHTRLLILEWCGEVPVFPTIKVRERLEGLDVERCLLGVSSLQVAELFQEIGFTLTCFQVRRFTLLKTVQAAAESEEINCRLEQL